jgi:hypothetical protein
LASIGTHHALHYGDNFSTLRFWIGFSLAHYIFVEVVRQIESRKTKFVRWMNLVYFAAYLLLLIYIYADNFANIGLYDGAAKADTRDFWTCLYFSIATWTTVGYGDVTATASAARFFAGMEALNGYLVMALFIAALVPVFQKLLQKPGDTPTD